MASPDLYFDTIFAFQRSAALHSAIELGLFTVIGGGARTAREIAERCSASARGLRVLCDYLTTLGFLVKRGDAYDLTEDSMVFLTRSSPAYLGGTAEFLYSAPIRDHFNGLTDAVRRGRPAESIVDGAHPMWVQFARAMAPMMAPAAQAIAEIVDAGSQRPMRVLDIAAGHGIFGIALAQRNPNAQIVATDWAPVLEVAAENARATGVSERYRTLPGDAFEVDFGGGFDVALVTNFLHHFDRETNVSFLRKTAAALEPGGRVVILEFVPNADRVTPPPTARFALVMLATTPDGDAYTFDELRAMLAEAGFADVAQHPLHGPQSVVVATK